MAKDENVSAAGYIITFFNDIENLTNSFAQFSNLLANLKGNYPTDDELKKLPEEQRMQLLQLVQDVRFWVNRTYVKFSALKASVKEFEAHGGKVDELYNALLTEKVPEFDKLKSYVIELNRLFVLGIVSTLLTKAYDIYAQFAGKTQ